MKSIASAASILLLLGAAASAQTLDDLKNDGKNTDNVLTYGMGYHQQRYSTLKQINKQNAKRLVPVWNVSLASSYGEQAQPLVYNGVMYVTNAEATVAIDIASGKQLWRTPVDFDPAVPRVVCCGLSNKGPAIFNGKVYRGTLDAHLVALDQQTGKQVWKEKVAEWKEGFSITGAPTVANGVLITGISGAEFGVRAFLDGYDPETGKQPVAPLHHSRPRREGPRHLAEGRQLLAARRRLDLDHRLVRSRARSVYWGTGNAGPWDPSRPPRRQSLHRLGAGDRARRPVRSSGTISWCPTRCSTSTRCGS